MKDCSLGREGRIAVAALSQGKADGSSIAPAECAGGDGEAGLSQQLFKVKCQQSHNINVRDASLRISMRHPHLIQVIIEGTEGTYRKVEKICSQEPGRELRVSGSRRDPCQTPTRHHLTYSTTRLRHIMRSMALVRNAAKNR